MGLTCASLHLFAPDCAAAELDKTIDAAGDRLGYERIDKPEEADRELTAVPAPPWISFFDLSNPNTVTDDLTGLGKQLSAVSKRPVLLTAVWDSDVFGFLLFEHGKQVDGHASGRGLLPGRIRKWPPDKRAREWSRTFERSIGVEAVQRLTEKGLLFAEELLARCCEMVGLSGDLAARVPRDLDARPLPNHRRYYYKSRPQPAGAQPITQTLAYKGATLEQQIVVRQEHSSVFELNGPAAVFVDPILEFSGSAIDTGIVSLTESFGHWSLGIEHILAGGAVRFDAEISSAEAGGRQVMRACLKGLSAERRAFPPRKKSILSFWYTLRGVAPGAGQVHVSLLPNPQAVERLPMRPQLLVDVIR
jgi:hypothetical protein